MRSLFLFALLVAAASAFVAPANRAVGEFLFDYLLLMMMFAMDGWRMTTDRWVVGMPEGRDDRLCNLGLLAGRWSSLDTSIATPDDRIIVAINSIVISMLCECSPPLPNNHI